MKNILNAVLIIIIINSNFLFAQMQTKLQEGTEIFQISNPKGATGISLIQEGKTFRIVDSHPNDDKEVIVELTQAPVKTFRGQMNFNFFNENRSIELIHFEHQRFIDDLERIINNIELQNASSYEPADYTIKFRYRIALNGMSIKTKQWVIDELKELDYVKTIHDVVEVSINDDISNQVIQVDSVWANFGVTGEGMLISIIDTGIDSNHVTLNNGKVIDGYNFVNNTTNFFDDHGHGTHCAGIAAANGNGLTGVAPDALLLGVKVLNAGGSGSNDAIIAGIEFSLDPDGNPNTDDGADVISMSLGGWGYPEDATSIATNNAVANGVVCVVAAGNSGDFYTIGSPGCAKDAFTVGATNNNDQIASFSSKGPIEYYDIIKPDITAPGVAIYSSLPNNQFNNLSGTSMSTPHVAGAAALLLQINPDWTPQQIKSAFMGTAVDVGASIWEQGAGRMDVYRAAQNQSILVPSSINFGNIELSDSFWEKSDTLTLYNKSQNTQTYNLLLDYDFPDGFTYELVPETVTINSDSSAKIILKVFVDNSNFPIPNIFPPTYKGKIIAQSDNDEIKADFIISKARMLHINLDENANWIFIFDRKENDRIYKVYQHKQNISVPITLDTFDIIVFFSELTKKYFYVEESFIVDSDTSYYLNISKQDCINKIHFNYLDKDDNPTDYFNFGIWYFKMVKGWSIYLSSRIYNEYYGNNMSNKYELGVGTISYIKTELDLFDKFIIMYATNNGINQSETINISPGNSFEINYKYDDLKDINNKYIAECFGFPPVVSLMFYYTEDMIKNIHGFDLKLRSEINTKRKFYHFINSDKFWNSSQYQEEPATLVTQLSPIVKVLDNKLCFLTHNQLDTIKSFELGSYSLNIDGYQFFNGKISYNNISIEITRPNTTHSFNKPGLFNNRYGFSFQKPLKFQIANQGNVIIDTILHNSVLYGYWAAMDNDIFYNNLGLPSGFNEVKIEYDSLKFYDKYGFAKISCGFNSPSGDMSFPEFKSLIISNNDIIKEIYAPNDTISIKCKLSNLLETDTLRIYYREFESSEWIQLEFDDEDGFYIAKIDTTDLFSYYSVKILVKRDNNDYLLHELEPAFYTGLTSPKLISPEIDSKHPLILDLTWQTVPFADYYLIQISTDEDFNNLIVNDTVTTAIFSLSDHLNYWSTYYWQVKAITNNQSSKWSETRRFHTITDPNIPSYNLCIWGSNLYGQLGDSTSTKQLTPTPISDLKEWNSISAGYYFNHSIKSDGTLWAWGANHFNQLGFGGVIQVNYPVQVGEDFDWKSIFSGLSHTTGIKKSGHLWAWGYGSRGQVGDGTATFRNNPVQIGTYTNWNSVSCGLNNTLAIKTDGTLWAWGANEYGQLGDGTTNDRLYPVQIGADTDWMQIACSGFHTMGIKTDGTLWGWGDNSWGQFPDDREIVSNPVQIGNDADWKSVACGYSHTLGIKTDGTLWGFGRNYFGEVGDSTLQTRTRPVRIGSDTNWTYISCGGYHSKGIKSDGTLWTWGLNADGQLGDGTETNRLFPVKIDSDVIWRSISCGTNHSLALFYTAPILISPRNEATLVETTPTFIWEIFPNATTYKLQLSTNEDFDPLIINESEITAAEYSVTGLDEITDYYWRVQAINIDKDYESDWSEVRKFTTVPPIPQTPTLLSPANGAENQLLALYLGWNAVQHAEKYHLQVSESNNFNELIINSLNIVDTDYKLINLQYLTDYYWRVRAINVIGTSEWSEVRKFTTAPPVPQVPNLVNPANEADDLLPVLSLSWGTVQHASSYDLQVSKDDDFSTTIVNRNQTNTSYQLTILELGETYYWKVRAMNISGESDWSAVWSFTIAETIEGDIQYIPFTQGWNFISSYIETVDMSLEAIYEDIEDNIVIVKMGSGVYIPANNLNTLGDWNITKAYTVFASAATTLVMHGTAVIPEDTDIILTSGWNAVPYLRKESMAITQALAVIENKIVIVKNRSGQIWIPGQINTIQTMYPGEGYSVFMTSGAVFNYPGN